MRLLEVIGFSGSKTVGMRELSHAAFMNDTLRMVMARLTLLCWHLFITYFVGAGQPDLALCKRLLAPLIRNYPKVTSVGQTNKHEDSISRERLYCSFVQDCT